MSGRTQAPILRTNFRKRSAKIHSASPDRGELQKDNRSPMMKIKKELPDDEIKEYAATTMSEFLSWYGYDKVDSGCTRGLNLDHFSSSVHHNSHILSHNLSPKVIASKSPLSTNLSSSPQSRSSKSPPASTTNSIKDAGRILKETTMSPISLKTAPASPRLQENSDSASESPGSPVNCSWCGEPGGGQVCGIANGSEQFCSEACFAAGRRAAFKRARICDWCRHVRHSISYVDFQDGESQLQFCSDKCLNQYKMNIFCRETQAHLALHNPSNTTTSNLTGGNLITPELWLRDCRSAPPSPAEEMLVVDDDEPITRSELRQDKRSPHQDSNSQQKSVVQGEKSKGRNLVNGRTRFKSNSRLNKECNSETEPEEESPKNSEATDLSFEGRVLNRLNMSDHLTSMQKKDDINLDSSSRETPDISSKLKQPLELLSKESKSRRSHRHSRPQRVFQANTWVPENSTRILAPIVSPPRNPYPQSAFKLPPHPAVFTNPTYPIRSPLQPRQVPQLAQSSAAPSLVPPVTVLVPYPIPIPIPLPIPIPIPLFGFLPDKKNETKDEVPVPEDLSKHTLEKAEKAEKVEKTEEKDSSPVNEEEETPKDNVDDEKESVCLTTSTPFRKRRRLIQDKFVPA